MMPAISLFFHRIAWPFYSFYLIDYKIGFTSRALIGSVVEVLTNNITIRWLNGFIFISFIFTFSLLSFLLSKVIRSADDDLKNMLLFALLFLAFYKLSIQIFIEYYGMLDIYWLMFLLFAFVFINRRLLSFLVPLLCFLGLATNFAFAFTYMPIIAFVIVYDLYDNKFHLRNMVLTTISFFVMVGASVYFFIFANNTLAYTPDEIYQYLSAKVNFPVVEYYIHLYFTVNSNSFSDLLKDLRTYMPNFFSSTAYYPMFVRAIPVLVCIPILWIKAIRSSSKNLEKGFLILATLLPVFSFPAFLFSMDIDRFLAHTILAQFSLVFYLIFKKNEAVILAVKQLYHDFKTNPVLLVVFFVSALF